MFLELSPAVSSLSLRTSAHTGVAIRSPLALPSNRCFSKCWRNQRPPCQRGSDRLFRRSGGIRAGSTNSPKTLQNNGVAACGIPPSRLFKATHLPLTREALGEADSSRNIYLTLFQYPSAEPIPPSFTIHYSPFTGLAVPQAIESPLQCLQATDRYTST